MATTEHLSVELHGMYHDVLRDADGHVLFDRGWHHNTIVVQCRKLLAGFMAGPLSLGVQGMRVGKGSDAWDLTSPPAPSAAQTALVDPNPFLVPKAALQIDFLDAAAAVTPSPTNRLQIVATLGPNVPAWPDVNHASGNLREFGLVGQLSGVETLINYVTHPVIVKDPLSTLTRTVWLVF